MATYTLGVQIARAGNDRSHHKWQPTFSGSHALRGNPLLNSGA